MLDQELIPHSTILSMVESWQTVQAKIRKAYELMEESENFLKVVFDKDIHLDIKSGYGIKSDYAERVIDDVRRHVWGSIINKSEMRRFLSIKRAEELDKNISQGKLPELTAEEIQNLIKSAMANVHDFADEMVVEVYNYLRPYNNEYWNNRQFAWELGKRVILGYAVESGYTNKPFRANYNREKELRALDNVFHALDGQGFSTSYHGELSDAINASDTGEGETPYFKFKCYRNKNLHLVFKRLDLVAKMNSIASKNVLKPQNKG